MSTIDETEQAILRTIADIQKQHRRELEPWFKKLAEVRSLRPPTITFPLPARHWLCRSCGVDLSIQHHSPWCHLCREGPSTPSR